MYRLSALLAGVVLMAACSSGGGAAPAANEPDPTPEPTATPTAWRLDVIDAEYTTKARVGDTISIDLKVKNAGTAKNPRTVAQFSELDKYADIDGCNPKCEVEDLPGFGPSALMPGVATKKTGKFHIEFVANEVGVVRWMVCVYDDDHYSEQVWCGDGKTTIR